MSGAHACPACAGALPDLADAVPVGRPTREFMFSLPTIHCAGCISTVEQGLAGMPAVVRARVNLTQKRLFVEAADDEGVEEALIDRIASLGFAAEPLDTETLARVGTDSRGRMLLLRLGVAGFAAMNVMLLSVSVWSGAEGATRDFLHWVSAAIALPATIFAAQPFFAAACAGLRARRLVMDTPISLAILLALGVSLFETSQSGEHAYFDAALSLTFFLLLGRYLDHRSRAAARSAATELAALEVPRAERIGADGKVETVGVRDLLAGDMILIRPGARVPVDGIVRSGATELDRSLLTGETQPIAAGLGATVHAGEQNLTGALDVEVTAVGEDTGLSRIAALVRAAEAAKNRYVSLAERAARVYAPVVHLLAFFAFIGWFWATGDVRLSVNVATAVLIITCPCALGLAVPSVMISASAALFRRGVLLKDGTALERLARVDEAVVDKTGTLTIGAPELVADPRRPTNALATAAALGRGSNHPLAQAIARKSGGLTLPPVEDLIEHPGKGVEGWIYGRHCRLGRADWVGALPSSATETWLRIDAALPVRFAFEDSQRPGADEMVTDLAEAGIGLTLLSGDTTSPVAAMAELLGIARHQGQLLPHDKQARIADLKRDGHGVLMIGDGLNDTAALAEADVSIAPASGVDVTRTAADIILMNPNLTAVGDTVRIARAARRRILENFGLAATYNLIAVPLALAGIATPLMAALAMSASSICVSLNALRIGARR